MPPDETKLPDDFVLPDSLPAGLVEEITAVLNDLPTTPEQNDSPVNWRYLDQLESGEIDVAQFPEWAQYLLLEIDDPQQEQFLKRFILQYLSNPPSFSDDESS